MRQDAFPRLSLEELTVAAVAASAPRFFAEGAAEGVSVTRRANMAEVGSSEVARSHDVILNVLTRLVRRSACFKDVAGVTV